MQSSAMNWPNARLRTSTHSRRLSRRGLAGTRPVIVERVCGSDAVDNGEGPHARLRRALPAPAHEQPHRRPDPAGKHEPGSERAGRDERQLAAQLAGDVRHLADASAQLIDRTGQLLALRLDVTADLLRRASVTSP